MGVVSIIEYNPAHGGTLKMGEISPIHVLILLVLLAVLGVPWLAYRHGKKVGDQAGYIRGYKEGQQSPHVMDAGTLRK
jgi:hypothetical protein